MAALVVNVSVWIIAARLDCLLYNPRMRAIGATLTAAAGREVLNETVIAVSHLLLPVAHAVPGVDVQPDGSSDVPPTDELEVRVGACMRRVFTRQL
jgi:hypothetical protein